MALIILDYDGVLADTLEDLILSGQEACDRLGIGHMVSAADLAGLEVMSFSNFGRACGASEAQVDEFVHICLEYAAKKENPPEIFPGMAEAVRQLSASHKIAIVTTNSSRIVNAFLARHELSGLIQAVYGVDAPGTKAQKIALAREKLLGPESQAPVFMAGDALSDMLAAKEASAAGIAVGWGHQSLSTLLLGQPAYVVHAPAELVQVIEKAVQAAQSDQGDRT